MEGKSTHLQSPPFPALRENLRKITDDFIALFLGDCRGVHLRNSGVVDGAGAVHVKHAAYSSSPNVGIACSSPHTLPRNVLVTVAAHAVVHEVVASRAGRKEGIEVDQFGEQFIGPGS